MLFNRRTKAPRIQVMSDEGISANYKTTQEIETAQTEIDSFETELFEFNENLFGFDTSRGPREFISRQKDGSFKRVSNFNNGNIIDDLSLSDRSFEGDEINVVDHAISNDKILIVESDEQIGSKVQIAGIGGGLYATQPNNRIGRYATESYDKTDFYEHLSLSDICHSYIIHNHSYIIYRGGYVVKFNNTTHKHEYIVLDGDVSDNVQMDITDPELYYAKQQHGGGVINTSIDREAGYVYVLTMNDLHIIDCTTGKSRVIEYGFVEGDVVIDMVAGNNGLYLLAVIDSSRGCSSNNVAVYFYNNADHTSTIVTDLAIPSTGVLNTIGISTSNEVLIYGSMLRQHDEDTDISLNSVDVIVMDHLFESTLVTVPISLGIALSYIDKVGDKLRIYNCNAIKYSDQFDKLMRNTLITVDITTIKPDGSAIVKVENENLSTAPSFSKYLQQVNYGTIHATTDNDNVYITNIVDGKIVGNAIIEYTDAIRSTVYQPVAIDFDSSGNLLISHDDGTFEIVKNSEIQLMIDNPISISNLDPETRIAMSIGHTATTISINHSDVIHIEDGNLTTAVKSQITEFVDQYETSTIVASILNDNMDGTYDLLTIQSYSGRKYRIGMSRLVKDDNNVITDTGTVQMGYVGASIDAVFIDSIKRIGIGEYWIPIMSSDNDFLCHIDYDTNGIRLSRVEGDVDSVGVISDDNSKLHVGINGYIHEIPLDTRVRSNGNDDRVTQDLNTLSANKHGRKSKVSNKLYNTDGFEVDYTSKFNAMCSNRVRGFVNHQLKLNDTTSLTVNREFVELKSGDDFHFAKSLGYSVMDRSVIYGAVNLIELSPTKYLIDIANKRMVIDLDKLAKASNTPKVVEVMRSNTKIMENDGVKILVDGTNLTLIDGDTVLYNIANNDRFHVPLDADTVYPRSINKVGTSTYVTLTFFNDASNMCINYCIIYTDNYTTRNRVNLNDRPVDSFGHKDFLSRNVIAIKKSETIDFIFFEYNRLSKLVFNHINGTHGILVSMNEIPTGVTPLGLKSKAGTDFEVFYTRGGYSNGIESKVYDSNVTIEIPVVPVKPKSLNSGDVIMLVEDNYGNTSHVTRFADMPGSITYFNMRYRRSIEITDPYIMKTVDAMFDDQAYDFNCVQSIDNGTISITLIFTRYNRTQLVYSGVSERISRVPVSIGKSYGAYNLTGTLVEDAILDESSSLLFNIVSNCANLGYNSFGNGMVYSTGDIMTIVGTHLCRSNTVDDIIKFNIPEYLQTPGCSNIEIIDSPDNETVTLYTIKSSYDYPGGYDIATIEGYVKTTYNGGDMISRLPLTLGTYNDGRSTTFDDSSVYGLVDGSNRVTYTMTNEAAFNTLIREKLTDTLVLLKGYYSGNRIGYSTIKLLDTATGIIHNVASSNPTYTGHKYNTETSVLIANIDKDEGVIYIICNSEDNTFTYIKYMYNDKVIDETFAITVPVENGQSCRLQGVSYGDDVSKEIILLTSSDKERGPTDTVGVLCIDPLSPEYNTFTMAEYDISIMDSDYQILLRDYTDAEIDAMNKRIRKLEFRYFMSIDRDLNVIANYREDNGVYEYYQRAGIKLLMTFIDGKYRVSFTKPLLDYTFNAGIKVANDDTYLTPAIVPTVTRLDVGDIHDVYCYGGVVIRNVKDSTSRNIKIKIGNILPTNVLYDMVNTKIIFDNNVSVVRVTPAVFMGHNMYLIQYELFIKVYLFNDRLESKCIHTIIQSPVKTFKTITAVQFAGNKVLMTTSDGELCYIRLNSIDTREDLGFNEYESFSLTSTVDYFINGIDKVGFVSRDGGIYIKSPKDVNFTKVSEVTTTKHIVSPILNRLYFVNDERHFGFLNFDTNEVTWVKTIHDDVINLYIGTDSIVYIVTTDEIWTYIGDSMFEENNPYTTLGEVEVISYPFTDYTEIESELTVLGTDGVLYNITDGNVTPTQLTVYGGRPIPTDKYEVFIKSLVQVEDCSIGIYGDDALMYSFGTDYSYVEFGDLFVSRPTCILHDESNLYIALTDDINEILVLNTISTNNGTIMYDNHMRIPMDTITGDIVDMYIDDGIIYFRVDNGSGITNELYIYDDSKLHDKLLIEPIG